MPQKHDDLRESNGGEVWPAFFPACHPRGFVDPCGVTLDMNPESRIAELKLQLPPVPKLGGVYKPVVVIGNVAYVSGHGPVLSDGSLIKGRLGQDMNLEQGREAARQVGLTILTALRAHFGSLNKVKRLLKSLGMVNCTPDFLDHPKVINGYSELMAEVFGPDNGIGARSAVGFPVLPGNIAVEIEAIFEIEP